MERSKIKVIYGMLFKPLKSPGKAMNGKVKCIKVDVLKLLVLNELTCESWYILGMIKIQTD